MFSLPQPPDEEVIDGLPVVRLSEDAEILNTLLPILYPVPSVVPASYEKALQLLAMCQKYDMAGVQSSIRTEIKSWGPVVLAGTVAYRAYAISSSAKLLPEVETSARHTLDFPMTLEYLSNELPLFPGWALRDLVRYRRRCRDGLVSVLQSSLNSSPATTWAVCSGNAQKNRARSKCLDSFEEDNSQVVRPSAGLPGWLRVMFSQHIQNLHEPFTDPFLKPSSIRGAYFAALTTHINSTDCHSCLKEHALKAETFCRELESKLAQALDKVSASCDSFLGI